MALTFENKPKGPEICSEKSLRLRLYIENILGHRLTFFLETDLEICSEKFSRSRLYTNSQKSELHIGLLYSKYTFAGVGFRIQGFLFKHQSSIVDLYSKILGH